MEFWGGSSWKGDGGRGRDGQDSCDLARENGRHLALQTWLREIFHDCWTLIVKLILIHLYIIPNLLRVENVVEKAQTICSLN